jgi:hypothetical protein
MELAGAGCVVENWGRLSGILCWNVGIASVVGSSASVICLGGLRVLRPQSIEVLTSSCRRECFETGDVLEQTQHHIVELGAGQSRPELLDDDLDEPTHLVVIECVE